LFLGAHVIAEIEAAKKNLESLEAAATILRE
jgi:hypothetical protein